MSLRTLLVVEDDAAIRRGLVDALSIAGYSVLEAPNGTRGMELGTQAEVDLVLLDLVLPGPNGLDILKEIRRSRPVLPVIIMTAKGEEQDRIQGLRQGADDYVVKPFSVAELLARIEAVLRRSPERPSDLERVELPGACADFARRELTYADGGRCELSERETELLRYLVTNRGRAISRDEILSRVWRISPSGVRTRTIDMHVARLREKLRDDPVEPKVIVTVRRKGYMFGVAEKTT